MQNNDPLLSLGAIPNAENHTCHFKVWAPNIDKVQLELYSESHSNQKINMQKDNQGYHTLTLKNIEPGAHYYYWLNQLTRRPDPASRFQPEGVFGPSQVVTPDFPWTDQHWHGLTLEKYIIYELHVGLFTAAGNFDALIPHLDSLKDLGITAIELMPIAQFSGQRNWGYDVALPFAVQNSYGDPAGLRRLVNACHTKGLAVILDVIYNHFGPEGNFFADFGPYFSKKYQTPWGLALNFDAANNDHVRQYFIENAIHWFSEYHIDALRLDAIQEIFDTSAYPFLAQLADVTNQLALQLEKSIYLIAESDLNDAKLVSPRSGGGYGIHAQWNDDFHHALHALMTHEKNGYYADFGQLHHLGKAIEEGFVYAGQYSTCRKRNHGICSRAIDSSQFVVCAQNHDQIGNHQGQRLTHRLSLQQLKLMAAVVILSPYIPLIFMGEEYAETASFNFFVDFNDKNLNAAVKKGRQQEMIDMCGDEKKIPTPDDESTFLKAKLQHDLKNEPNHNELWNFYKILIQLRKQNPVLAHLSKEDIHITMDDTQQLMLIERHYHDQHCLLIFNFNSTVSRLITPAPNWHWKKILSTADQPDIVETNKQCSITISAYGIILLSSV